MAADAMRGATCFFIFTMTSIALVPRSIDGKLYDIEGQTRIERMLLPTLLLGSLFLDADLASVDSLQ